MDCDPERPAGILHPEGTRAITTACGAWDDLRSSGFGDPVVADSGNGGHLLYRQDLPNDQLANALIQRVLIGVATRCAPYDVDIDLAVYNAARICKLYGTMARKAIRPSIVPTGIRAFLRSPAPRNPPVGGLVNPLDRVASWADDQPAAPIVEPSAAPPISQDFSVQAFIERHGLKVRRRGEWKGGEKWELEFCPINPEHTGGCVIITRGSNGSLGFKCQHNSCAGIGWTKLRERLEPGYRKSDCVAGWGGAIWFRRVAADRSVLRDICRTDTRTFASGSGRGHGAVRCGGNRDATGDGCDDWPWHPGSQRCGQSPDMSYARILGATPDLHRNRPALRKQKDGGY